MFPTHKSVIFIIKANNYISKDKTGISVNPEKPEEIADALIKLLTDNEMYNQCSINGIKAVDKKYNWGLMEEKLLGIYGKVLDLHGLKMDWNGTTIQNPY